MNKVDFMREQLGDLSDSTLIEIYDAFSKWDAHQVGDALDRAIGESVFAHYEESMVREPDEVDRRLDEEAA